EFAGNPERGILAAADALVRSHQRASPAVKHALAARSRKHDRIAPGDRPARHEDRRAWDPVEPGAVLLDGGWLLLRPVRSELRAVRLHVGPRPTRPALRPVSPPAHGRDDGYLVFRVLDGQDSECSQHGARGRIWTWNRMGILRQHAGVESTSGGMTRRQDGFGRV